MNINFHQNKLGLKHILEADTKTRWQQALSQEIRLCSNSLCIFMSVSFKAIFDLRVCNPAKSGLVSACPLNSIINPLKYQS